MKKKCDLLIVCLHGFLGQGADWQEMRVQVVQEHPELRVDFFCPSLFEPFHPLSPIHINFEEFPKRLIEFLRKQYEYKKIILIGYSMGGRLALNSVVQQPDFFDRAIFISTNPGLLGLEESKKKAENDKIWGQRFLSEDWEPLLSDWNQQPVFWGSEEPPPFRDEKLFSREALAAALVEWSVARQVIDLAKLKAIKTSNIWVVGEKDSKYVKILQTLMKIGVGSCHQIFPSRGHRIYDIPSPLLFGF